MSESVEIVAGLGGELVTYLPHNGVAKVFKAIVVRRPAPLQDGPGATTYPVNTMEVFFPRDSLNGVSTVNVRKDRISFKKNLSDEGVSEFLVQKVLQEDAGISGADGGMFHVQVQT